ncbi:hypothetical protein FRC20_003740, partial [Serendipita sp. 405]
MLVHAFIFDAYHKIFHRFGVDFHASLKLSSADLNIFVSLQGHQFQRNHTNGKYFRPVDIHSYQEGANRSSVAVTVPSPQGAITFADATVVYVEFNVRRGIDGKFEICHPVQQPLLQCLQSPHLEWPSLSHSPSPRGCWEL